MLVAGGVFAAGGTPVPASLVRAKVGPSTRRSPSRRPHLALTSAATDPVPFDDMPVDWAHAFGGPGFAANPHGKGARSATARGPLPNVEPYGASSVAPRIARTPPASAP